MKMYLMDYLLIIMLMIMLYLIVINLLIPSNQINIHPLFMGFIMLSYSILISLNLNMFNKSSLYSFISFLIIIGGFLILFLYFNSFAINNKMIYDMMSFKLLFYKSIILTSLLLFMIYKLNIYNMLLFLNNKLLEMINFNDNFKMMNNIEIKIIYMKLNNLTIFAYIYLLYNLIIIMKAIFYTNPKSLRKMK